ncbi:MAG: PD-(D/E)XK nuclease family protein [Candidatus Kaiserbacteria bacterium]|nr:PD-(D/E)XK nuclease family protein [Candidatus Kaiserbacteria bacterium]
MSNYYKPERKAEWNYGGSKWRLSRSKIDLFIECRRCFYIDNKLGTARPKGFPFNLNSAVDALLKKEFDSHRAAKTTHPLMKTYGLDAVPFAHVQMDEWRDSLKGGVVCEHETGMTVCGGVDDIWITSDNELIVVDYKATSKEGQITALDQDWHDGYKRQAEVYQWLLRRNGFKVSDTAYFVYCNASRDAEAFDGKLEFEVTLVPHKGDDSWVEGALQDIKATLENENLPAAAPDCDYCQYREAVGKKMYAYDKNGKMKSKQV